VQPWRPCHSGWQDPEPVKPQSSAEILPLLRADVAAAPDRADPKLKLAKALFRTDQMAEIVDRLEAGCYRFR
jgi:hypothetical protein